MSAINYRTGSLKPPAKPKHLSQLKEFIAPGEKIFQDKDVSDYDRLFDDKKELEQRLLLKKQEFNAKVEELSALRSAKAEEIGSLRSRTAETISISGPRTRRCLKGSRRGSYCGIRGRLSKRISRTS